MPKKRDKDDAAKKSDNSQTDHELFLQAFEKPTQIYRYLKERHKSSPVFLHRNLTYMHKYPERTNCNFNINDLLDRVENGKLPLHSHSSTKCLNISYLGFYNPPLSAKDPVKIETLLLKICHKKRKESICPITTESFDTVYAPLNPTHDVSNAGSSQNTVSIPTESFRYANGHLVKSYHLFLRVGTSLPNGVHKYDYESNDLAAKKRRLSVRENENGGTGHYRLYGTNLIVYDKQNRCLLPDGEYQLLLEEISPNSPVKLTHVTATWETLPIREEDEKNLPGFEKYTKGPTLRIRLCWVKETNNSKKRRDSDRYWRNRDMRVKIVYQFLYNHNKKQQTEASYDLHCPWCFLLCTSLYALLKHLKLCHMRFTFSYVPIPHGARIDVALNDRFDASYLGGTRDIANSTVGYAFARSGPIRRSPVSNILVCHPKRPRRPSLSEFLNEQEENDLTYDGQRSYVIGHNRQYHHTATCLPIISKEMDIDSEDERDPTWLRRKTKMMIDEFTDVNDGEKDLMKMWNLHIMKYGFVGDCQIPLACTMFLEVRGKELLKKNLYRNFVLHMCNLFDFGLISPVTVYTTIQRLQELIGDGTDVSKLLHESWKLQRNNWISFDNNNHRKIRVLKRPNSNPL